MTIKKLLAMVVIILMTLTLACSSGEEPGPPAPERQSQPTVVQEQATAPPTSLPPGPTAVALSSNASAQPASTPSTQGQPPVATAPPTAAPALAAHRVNSQPATQQATTEPNAPSAPPPTPFIPSTETDRQALVDLYEATDGSNWTSNDNWLTDQPLSEWYGVTTNGDRVAELDLADNGLSGHIPETSVT